jgi:pyruvate formate lyase activating enzyme
MTDILGNIHSVETFGTVDGPGIRFVVFMQGCPMRCLYCHNPDTWKIAPNQSFSPEQLLTQYDSCKEFYNNGGITVTGGEPLLQLPFVVDLFSKAQKHRIGRNQIKGKLGGIHTCLDTSGVLFSPEKADDPLWLELCTVTDLVLLDIKHMNDEDHKKITGHSNKNILDFAKFLESQNVPLVIRHVLVPSLTDSETHLQQLSQFAYSLKNLEAIDILPYHTMAIPKYQQLGIPYPLEHIPPATKADVEKARQIILSYSQKK